MPASLSQSDVRTKSRASFVSEGSVASWRRKYFRQGATTIVCRRATPRSHSSCLLCVLLTQSKCNVSPAAQRFGCNSTTYLLTYRCKRFYHCDCVSSDTSSSTSLSGTRGSYACTSGLCSTATQQGSHTLIIHWFYEHIASTHRWRKEVKCMCSLCSVATQQGSHTLIFIVIR